MKDRNYLRGMRAMQDRILNELNTLDCQGEEVLKLKHDIYRMVSEMPVVPDPPENK